MKENKTFFEDHNATAKNAPFFQMQCFNCRKLFIRKQTNMCQECWNDFAIQMELINEDYED